MATSNRKTTNRETVREDPPETSLTPSDNRLQLVNADGTGLINGNHNDRFQYCWVVKFNGSQVARYQAHGYRPCRLTPDEVRPRFQEWTLDEETQRDATSEPLIERAEMLLMKRPIKFMHDEDEARRNKVNAQRSAMRGVSSGDQRVAQRGYAHFEPLNNMHGDRSAV